MRVRLCVAMLAAGLGACAQGATADALLSGGDNSGPSTASTPRVAASKTDAGASSDAAAVATKSAGSAGPASTSPTEQTDACANGRKDGLETATDCGGPSCPKCALAKTCVVAGDCLSGACTNGSCTTPTTSGAGTTGGSGGATSGGSGGSDGSGGSSSGGGGGGTSGGGGGRGGTTGGGGTMGSVPDGGVSDCRNVRTYTPCIPQDPCRGSLMPKCLFERCQCLF